MSAPSRGEHIPAFDVMRGAAIIFVVAMARVAPSFAAEFMGIEPRRK